MGWYAWICYMEKRISKMAEKLVFLFSKKLNQLESISVYYFVRKLSVLFWFRVGFSCGPWLGKGKWACQGGLFRWISRISTRCCLGDKLTASWYLNFQNNFKLLQEPSEYDKLKGRVRIRPALFKHRQNKD